MPQLQPRRGVPVLGLSVGLILVIIALVTGLSVLHSESIGSASSSGTTDPRLVIHPTTTRLFSNLSGGLIASGSLSPTIPGKNTVRIAILRHGQVPASPLHVSLTVTMLDMKMAPKHAELVAGAHSYSGAIDLSMFGHYRVSISVETAIHRYHGAVTLALPLPRL